VIDPGNGAVSSTIDLGAALDPLGVAFNRQGTKAYVTEWAGRSVAVIDAATEKLIGRMELSPRSNPLQADHPSAIAASSVRDEVYTANANSDTVSVVDTRTDRLAATIAVGLVPNGPEGLDPRRALSEPRRAHALGTTRTTTSASATTARERRATTRATARAAPSTPTSRA
jgi:YVTN family beta-propeller protein